MQIAERDAVIKRVKANWASEWEKNLDAAERYAAGQVRAFYNSQAAIALDIFKRKGTIGADDVQFLYNTGDFTKIYEGLYESIGLRFAKWYTQNFDKLIKKGINPSSLVEPWRAYFKLVGASVAAERVTLVQGTARQNLIDVTRRLTTDDVFINEGADVRARMVRQKFDQYSQYQAERLVRTEATNIANVAVEVAAEDIFPGTDMQKEWISATDTRTRRFTNKDFADHLAMDGEIVDFDKPFEVPTIRGVEFLMRPGDTSGSPGNVINCRCSMAPFPKEGAQTVVEISDLGFGVADTLTAEGLSQLGTVVQTAVQAAVVEANIVASKPAQAIDDFVPAKTLKEAKTFAVEQLEKINISVAKIQVSREMTLENFNLYNRQFKKLLDEYDVSHKLNSTIGVQALVYKSDNKVHGVIHRYTKSLKLSSINLGHKTDRIKHRTRVLSKTELVRMPKSAIDEVNAKISTLTHEFAHIISDSEAPNVGMHVEFWDEIKTLRNKYLKDLRDYRDADSFLKFNETFLGEYSLTNADEFLAEAFTEYKLNSNPSKYARLVGEVVDRYFKK